MRNAQLRDLLAMRGITELSLSSATRPPKNKFKEDDDYESDKLIADLIAHDAEILNEENRQQRIATQKAQTSHTSTSTSGDQDRLAKIEADHIAQMTEFELYYDRPGKLRNVYVMIATIGVRLRSTSRAAVNRVTMVMNKKKKKSLLQNHPRILDLVAVAAEVATMMMMMTIQHLEDMDVAAVILQDLLHPTIQMTMTN